MQSDTTRESASSSSGSSGKRIKITSVETAPHFPIIEQATKLKYVTVGKSNKGGIRIVDVEGGRPFKLRDLLRLATEVYFAPTNYFNASPISCTFSLFNGNSVNHEPDLDEDLFKFLKRKHLLYDKTDFILRSIVADNTEH